LSKCLHRVAGPTGVEEKSPLEIAKRVFVSGLFGKGSERS
jgi:hypothetical protein